jgi:hypothetical protein
VNQYKVYIVDYCNTIFPGHNIHGRIGLIEVHDSHKSLRLKRQKQDKWKSYWIHITIQNDDEDKLIKVDENKLFKLCCNVV